MVERIYWLGFSVFSGIGPGRFRKLLGYFGSAKSAWRAGVSDLKKAGLGEKLVAELDDFRSGFSVNEYFRRLKKAGVKFFTWEDTGYPRLLSEIKSPPFVFYVKGNFSFELEENQKTIAIVGTRKITAYGRQVTEFLTRELVEAGCVVVSGLAVGVDALAHNATIESGGRTVAVLGSGVDLCYPRENEFIYKKILDSGGAVVSEYPLGQEPTKGSFPSRNRIIAGLSLGVVVAEGAEDSGALITASDAAAQQRKVFAIPGPITSSYSKGPNSLLAKGAIPVTSPEDILQALAIPKMGKVKNIKGDTREEKTIIALLQNEQMHIDELIKQTKIQAAQIGTVLSLMEMKGLVQNLGSGIFALRGIS